MRNEKHDTQVRSSTTHEQEIIVHEMHTFFFKAGAEEKEIIAAERPRRNGISRKFTWTYFSWVP